MENYSSETEKNISELPDVIIQHIQSFLKTKEAARTILISKSWLRAWSTRPFLDFDSDYLTHKVQDTDTYYEVIDRTIKNHVELGIPIAKLRLHVHAIQERWLQLVLHQNNVMELDINSWLSTAHWQEIFMTKSLLQVLRVNHRERSQLVLSTSDIKCRNLKKLQLHCVYVDCVTFQHIMCSCRLIEELLLYSCVLFDFPKSKLGIQSFMFTLRCESLKRLSLVCTKINDKQLEAILSKTPQLEDLSLIYCYVLIKPINLSSPSLTRLEIGNSKAVVVLIDVPNLRKVKYTSTRGFSAYAIPFLTITSPKLNAMVEVSILHCHSGIDELWFHGLRDFLTKFAKSNVKFSSYWGTPVRSVFHVLRATPLPCPHKVDTFKFKGWLENPQLLYAFTTICHPKIVLLGRLDSHDRRESLRELYKNLTSYKGDLECCKMNQNKCWQYYIKDAKLYYMVDNEQKPLDMNGLDRGLGNGEAITLAIEWESSD